MKYFFILVAVAAMGATVSALPPSALADVPGNESLRELSHEPRHRPVTSTTGWSVQVALSPSAFGGRGALPSRADAEALGTTVIGEYQPLRSFGTFGIGPVFSAYPVSEPRGVTSNFFSLWSLGAQARYQFRYVDGQILVPSLAYQYQQLRYSFTTGEQGWAAYRGPVAGLQFSLGVLDPGRARSLREDTGITATYLAVELRDLTGNDGTIGISRPGWYVGLSAEF